MAVAAAALVGSGISKMLGYSFAAKMLLSFGVGVPALLATAFVVSLASTYLYIGAARLKNCLHLRK
ncbi:MAG: hypothetical protein GC131_07170 [Alphaproteobacteria bacterium]|nr:hypothetical protein [Alphaproteobacteria bacterium]